MKQIFFLVIAAGIAFLASRWVENRISGKPEIPEHVEVVVAVSDINPGDILSMKNIRTESWASDSLPDGSFSSPESVKGRGAASRINAGEVIREERLVPLGQSLRTELARRIDMGMRAIAVKLDKDTFFLQPGDHADILVISKTGKGHVAQMLAENVRVLAIDGQDGSGDKPEVKSSKNIVAILLLTTEQSSALAAASQDILRLVARNRYDNATVLKDTRILSSGSFSSSGRKDKKRDEATSSLNKGMRAVTFPFTEYDGFCGWIMPQTCVDIIAVNTQSDLSVESLSPGSRANYLENRKFSRILLQNIRVLATEMIPRKNNDSSLQTPLQMTVEISVDRLISEMASNDKQKAGKSSSRETEKVVPRTIGYLSLMLDDDQAEQLLIASANYRLRFFYRNQDDPVIAETPGHDLATCFFRPFDERFYRVEFFRGREERLVTMPLPD